MSLRAHVFPFQFIPLWRIVQVTTEENDAFLSRIVIWLNSKDMTAKLRKVAHLSEVSLEGKKCYY